MNLTDFKALTFDCYGTLIDWETGIWNALQPLLSEGRLKLNREEALDAFGRHEKEQEEETPSLRYSSLLAVVHARLAKNWGAH
ncbi:MAG: haloacid dehalogenase, partial [Hyphomicrobiales bacterium]|nr:haloacid dehalogenase [Hyphomicrobiales bacterium]